MKLAQRIRRQLATARMAMVKMRVEFKSRANRAVLDEATRRLEAIIDYTDAAFAADTPDDPDQSQAADPERHRAEFEQWAGQHTDQLQRHPNGLYVNTDTQAAWFGWAAAMTRRDHRETP